MRRSREDAAETRRDIVDAASRLFRDKGIAAVSVADVMESLGLTVGGFYRHFESKDALVSEAIEAASLASLFTTETVARHGKRAAVEAYLSETHRKNHSTGCAVAALCSEIGHETRSTKRAFTRALERLLEVVGTAVAGGDQRRRTYILHTAAAAVGALVLARATDDDDLAREILAAVRSRILSERPSN